ncbi:VC0807 family protein [Thermopolyspora sp. NPDC052614]|uniref:VC0807 family protein n=1 Tax=Thermopolyspora sp. NPDC052614 TaxID=3155682 RepID=UPI0034363D22
MSHPSFALPRMTALIKQATPRLLEGVVAPLAVFYTAFAVLGLTGGLVAVLAWVYGGIGWRLIRRRPVPGTMLVAAMAITARSAFGWWTGSHVVYFIQPELGTICIAMAFLASVRLRRPLVERLTLDYIHLPAFVLRHERVRRFFARITLLWAFVLLVNSTMSIWLLLHESVGTYLLVRTSAVAVVSTLAVTFSVIAFRRVLRRLHAETPPPKALAPAA